MNNANDLLARNTDVVLNAGTNVYFRTATMPEKKQVLKVESIGAIGWMAEAKEKTTLENTSKVYGSGLNDAPDKAIKGLYIPVQGEGSELKQAYDDQQQFIQACVAEQEMEITIEWLDGVTATFPWKSLGWQIEEGTVDDWKKWTANGKQNAKPIWGQK